MNDWIISIDDHIIEPPDLWTSRLPQRYRDIGPRVEHTDAGDRWRYEGLTVGVSGLVTSAGLGDDGYNPMPVDYADMRAACYQPAARLEAMDADHILASMAFPNFPRFCGQTFMEANDKELALLCVRAYNDFLLGEWREPAPARLIPAIIIPLWDPHLAAAEIERCAALGARSVIFSEHPPSLGLPSIHDRERHWDPMFAAAADAQMPISIHIGSSSKSPTTGADAPILLASILTKWTSATTCADWLFCDALRRHPGLRISLSEGGISWLPAVLGAADYGVDHYRYNDHFRRDMDTFMGFTRRDEAVASWPHGDKSPTEMYCEHIRGCFVGGMASEADISRFVIDYYGPEHFLVEADFPHHDSSFPNTADKITEIVEVFPDDAQARLRRGNAIDWYSLDAATLADSIPVASGSPS